MPFPPCSGRSEWEGSRGSSLETHVKLHIWHSIRVSKEVIITLDEPVQKQIEDYTSLNSDNLIKSTKKTHNGNKEDKNSRPKISDSKEMYILKKYDHKCAGPGPDSEISNYYVCPLKKNGDGNLINNTLFGKIYQIDHIIERNESSINTSLVNTIDNIQNLQPLCLICHTQKTQIYNAIKNDLGLLGEPVGKLWKILRQNREGPIYGNN